MGKIVEMFVTAFGLILFFKIIAGFAGIWIAISPSTLFLSIPAYFGTAIFVKVLIDKVLGFDIDEDEDLGNILRVFPGMAGVAPVLIILGSNLAWDSDYMCENYFVGGQGESKVWAYDDDLKYGDVGTYTQAYMNIENKACSADPVEYFSSADRPTINPSIRSIGNVYGALIGAGLLGFLFMFGGSSVGHQASEERTESRGAGNKKKVTPGIGRDGRTVIETGNPLSSGFDSTKYCITNINDIIERNHLRKGDYGDFFITGTSNYLHDYPKSKKHASVSEMKAKLDWAIEQIPEVYKGKAEETGARRRAKLEELKDALDKV